MRCVGGTAWSAIKFFLNAKQKRYKSRNMRRRGPIHAIASSSDVAD